MVSPWPLPCAFTSWGFNKNPDGTEVSKNAVRDLGLAAARMGAKSIAVQLTEGITGGEVAELKALGYFVVGWCLCDSRTGNLLADLWPDGFCPQIEGPGQYDATVAALNGGVGKGLPKAIVSDYGGLGSKARCDVLRRFGCETLFVEAYADSGARHADLPHYVTELAANYGYDANHAVPVMGTFRNEYPSSYAGVDQYGPSFGVYLIEPMSGTQLDAFGEQARKPAVPLPLPPTTGGPPVSTPPTLPTTAPPTDSQVRAGIRAHAQSWESQQPSYQARARITVARRIVDDSNNNDKWTKGIPDAIPPGTSARDAIVWVLDNVGVSK